MKKKIVRPRAPAHGLKEAAEMTEVLYGREHRNPFTAVAVAKHLGMSTTSSSFRKKVSSLKHFGLLAGPTNSLRVTQLGVSLVSTLPVSSPDLYRGREEACLNPSVFRDLVEEFEASDSFPSEEEVKASLVDSGFSDVTAGAVARAFLESVVYAGLLMLTPDGEPKAHPRPEKSAAQRWSDYYKYHGGVPDRVSVPLPRGRKVIVAFPNDLTNEEVEKIRDVLDALVSEVKGEGPG